jgi:tripartite-type tricarboxylate transporter receptor subunit TctC
MLTSRFFSARLMCLSVLGGLVLLATSSSSAQSFPNKPLRLVVPFPAGGPTDIVARPLAILLGERLKQPVVIDNKGGAGGAIGADFVAKAPADGYTLFMGTVGTNAINGSLYKKLSYDPVKDFTPIALVASAPLAIVVNSSDASQSLADFVKVAKLKPDAIQFGTAGNGTPGHLTGALFESTAQIKLRHIPYKGSAPAVTDLIGGQISSMFDPLQSVIPHIQSGRLRVLAVTSANRSPVLPNVPTVSEQGYPQFEATAWWAVFAPARLPEAVLQQLRGEVEKIAASAAFAEKLGTLGILPNTDFRENLANFQTREIIRWSKAVRDSGATVD